MFGYSSNRYTAENLVNLSKAAAETRKTELETVTVKKCVDEVLYLIFEFAKTDYQNTHKYSVNMHNIVKMPNVVNAMKTLSQELTQSEIVTVTKKVLDVLTAEPYNFTVKLTYITVDNEKNVVLDISWEVKEKPEEKKEEATEEKK